MDTFRKNNPFFWLSYFRQPELPKKHLSPAVIHENSDVLLCTLPTSLAAPSVPFVVIPGDLSELSPPSGLSYPHPAQHRPPLLDPGAPAVTGSSVVTRPGLMGEGSKARPFSGPVSPCASGSRTVGGGGLPSPTLAPAHACPEPP